ncbi:LysR family transcriptional regulator [Corallococcus exiguus]|uniref:LysR family transcriptional regulator n=1 Tax=Corallococcus TaxID=83461 RepID=UPI000EE8145F|nr:MULTISPECIES: LysR family transcriptional regulator [Corallococcus]NNB99529.1 LysR family transcriptional regulator [Corallococcus exiguus]NNC08382.1 LysR family transcriptional regulator [Corallococcus exiguus]NPC52324.1 LysR family transcriptional regulator [Corallococcus exiguus]RKH85829.1 LysR family transcriptional regulator [Corallococcus sp. AB032C]
MMVRITGVNLSAIDLNLFLVLHAVLESGRATGAARELHVTQSAVSNALARLRDVLGDPLVAARSDLIAGVPRRVAKAFCDMLPLRMVEMPFPLPRMTKCLIWHTRTDADPGARYFRSLVIEALRE